jgi:CRISPR-associated protein (TIGR02710 family)
MTSQNGPVLGIYTVGGSPEPIIASLKERRPDRIVFIASPDTIMMVEDRVVPEAKDEEVIVGPGQYEADVVPDAQDFADCVRKLKELGEQVHQWLGRGENYQVYVDFTGGTKCLSAALTLVAQRWPGTFVYVGGTERTKDGVGVVVSGKEHILHAENPWNVLGYQAVEDALVLFDHRAYSQATAKLDQVLRATTDVEVKSEVSALRLLCEAYELWERFNHQQATQKLKDVLRKANDLRHLLGPSVAGSLLTELRKNLEFLDSLLADPKGRGLIIDLLANAERRGLEGRYDDGVARLYRSIEALAQDRLRGVAGIENTGNVSLNKIPEQLRTSLGLKEDNGTMQIALQDSYAILAALGDELGKQFLEMRLNDPQKSPLVLRNRSILAHGFEAITKRAYDQLLEASFKLAGVTSKDLPSFFRFSGQ